jgi:hypothetical protein
MASTDRSESAPCHSPSATGDHPRPGIPLALRASECYKAANQK